MRRRQRLSSERPRWARCGGAVDRDLRLGQGAVLSGTAVAEVTPRSCVLRMRVGAAPRPAAPARSTLDGCRGALVAVASRKRVEGSGQSVVHGLAGPRSRRATSTHAGPQFRSRARQRVEHHRDPLRHMRLPSMGRRATARPPPHLPVAPAGGSFAAHACRGREPTAGRRHVSSAPQGVRLSNCVCTCRERCAGRNAVDVEELLTKRAPPGRRPPPLRFALEADAAGEGAPHTRARQPCDAIAEPLAAVGAPPRHPEGVPRR